ncbi:sensor histidine kinase [Streptomyces sp. NPDC017940]|uniref:sensor histidine kinase n=1 Tax=Streptomyces sp. NPDC017940 TaxID=3365017 RepID=UPI00379CE7B9
MAGGAGAGEHLGGVDAGGRGADGVDVVGGGRGGVDVGGRGLGGGVDAVSGGRGGVVVVGRGRGGVDVVGGGRGGVDVVGGGRGGVVVVGRGRGGVDVVGRGLSGADAVVPAMLLAGHLLAVFLSGALTEGSPAFTFAGAPWEAGAPGAGGASGGASGAAGWQALVGVLVLAVVAVVLTERRRAPVPVFAVALVADGVTEALLPQPVVTPGPACALWIALFSLATHDSARRALGAAILATAVLPLRGIPLPGIQDPAPGPLLDDLLAGALLHLAIVLCGRLRHHRTARRTRLRARLAEVERERRAAVAAERERLARDLHDAVGHHLTGVAVQSAAALRLAAARPELAGPALAAAAATGRDVLAALGRLVSVVGDETPDAPPHESVPHLCAGLERLGFPVTLTTEGRPRPLPGETAVAAYRIVQESLTNAMRYAAGAPVTVSLRHGPGAEGELRVAVVNGRVPGRATVPCGPLGTGRGLVGMRERAEGVGGRLAAGPTDDGGWTVEATLPVPGPRPRARARIADAAAFALCVALPLLLSVAPPDAVLRDPAPRHLALLAVLLALHAAPLLIRRRAPATALAALLVTALAWSATCSAGWLDFALLGPLAFAWTAELIALYAVGAYGPARVTWPAPVAVGLAGGLAVGFAVAGDPAETAGPGAVPLLAALGLAAVPWLLPVWALGLLARARRGEGGPWERRLLDAVAARVGDAVTGERRRVATGLHATVVAHTVALVHRAEEGLLPPAALDAVPRLPAASGAVPCLPSAPGADPVLPTAPDGSPGPAADPRKALAATTDAARAALAGLRELLDALEEPGATMSPHPPHPGGGPTHAGRKQTRTGGGGVNEAGEA